MKCVLLIVLLTLFALSQAGFGPGEQDHGFVNVRKGAHMFWWLYHTTANVTDSSERPLILWLAGGPGGSSCGHGNFGTMGPLDENLQPRENTWVKDYNILFVDNPVGAGFSYVEDLFYLSTDNNQIAMDLVEVMKAFFQRNPKFKTSPLYLYGISYGGKMAVDLAALLDYEIKKGNIECNFKGVSMGNAWIAPVELSLGYAPFLHEMGLVDERGRSLIASHFDYVKELCDAGHYFNGCLEWFRAMGWIQYATDGVDIYDARSKITRPESLEAYKDQLIKKLTMQDQSRDLDGLMNGPVKQALGIPSNIIWGAQANYVLNYLFDDFMTPVTSSVRLLLNQTNVEVHVCNGNFDVICNTPGTMAWVNDIRWNDEDEFKNANRTTIWVNDTMEGYEKKGGRMNFYWINGAGHDAITGNPAGTAAFLKSMTGI